MARQAAFRDHGRTPRPLGPAPDFLGVGSSRERRGSHPAAQRRGSHPHPRIEYGASSGQAPGPLVKGEGEEPPSQSSPQMGEEGDQPCPSAPLDSGPVSSTGQAFRRNDGVMPGSPSVSSTGRLYGAGAGMTRIGTTGAVTLTPALSRQGRGGKSPLPRSLFSCVVGLGFIRGVSGRGVWSRWVRSRGPARASAV